MTDQRNEMPELRSCSAMVTTMRDNPYPCNFPAKRLINGKYLCGTHSRTIKKLCAESPPVPDDVAEAVTAARKVFPAGWDGSSKSAGSALLYIAPRENIGLTYGHIETLIRATSTPSPIICAEKLSDEDIEKLKNPACGYVVAVASTPSAEVQSLNDARAAMLVLADQRQRAIDDVKALQEELAEYEHVNQLLNRDNKSWRKDNKALREALEWTCKRITYLEDTIGGRHVCGIPASVEQALNQTRGG